MEIFGKCIWQRVWYMHWHKHEHVMFLTSFYIKWIMFIIYDLHMKAVIMLSFMKICIGVHLLKLYENCLLILCGAISQWPICCNVPRTMQSNTCSAKCHMQDMYFWKPQVKLWCVYFHLIGTYMFTNN